MTVLRPATVQEWDWLDHGGRHIPATFRYVPPGRGYTEGNKSGPLKKHRWHLLLFHRLLGIAGRSGKWGGHSWQENGPLFGKSA